MNPDSGYDAEDARMTKEDSRPDVVRKDRNVFRVRLVGPVLFYDMVRLGRRSRYFVIRAVYLLVLLLFLYFLQQRTYYQLATMGPQGVTQIFAEFGERFFFYYTLIQFLTVLAVTPALVAGTIAEEKERRTLEYLLATDLTNREIVLGKLFSRLALLLLFLLAGLPVLSLSLLFGGISPDLMVCSGLATLVTLLSVAAVSLFISVYVRRVRDAVLLSYLSILGFFVLWLFLEGVRLFIELDGKSTPASLGATAVVTVFRWGNPFYALYELYSHVQRVGTINAKAYELLAKYAGFHGVIIVLALALALALVRWLYVTQILEAKQPKSRSKAIKPVWVPRKDGHADQPAGFVEPSESQRAKASRSRPPVWDDCMMWKELFVERSLKVGILGEVLLSYFALALMFPILIAVGVALLNALSGTGWVEESQLAVNYGVRWSGMLVAALVYIGVATRACNSITSERDRNTLESLLSTPLDLGEILFAKWIGSLYGARFLFGLLALIWLLGLISGGLHVLAALPTVVTVAVLASFSASLGMYLGLRIRNGLLAQLSVVMLILCLGTASWGAAYVITDETFRDPYRHPYSYLAVVLRSISPFYLTEFIPFCGSDLRAGDFDDQRRWYREDFVLHNTTRYLHAGQLGFVFLFLSLYGLAALVLWSRSVLLFARTSGRTRSGPDRSKPPALPRSQVAKAPAAVA
ncbi:MAG: ABC transporter permease subunit [Gemmatales bacterium]|nr:ABC transporter permease subunit [Gemmatales bacterium]MDW8387108.1 ABC transporter permease subunit [Gemmatales bacterium]